MSNLRRALLVASWLGILCTFSWLIFCYLWLDWTLHIQFKGLVNIRLVPHVLAVVAGVLFSRQWPRGWGGRVATSAAFALPVFWCSTGWGTQQDRWSSLPFVLEQLAVAGAAGTFAASAHIAAVKNGRFSGIAWPLESQGFQASWLGLVAAYSWAFTIPQVQYFELLDVEYMLGIAVVFNPFLFLFSALAGVALGWCFSVQSLRWLSVLTFVSPLVYGALLGWVRPDVSYAGWQQLVFDVLGVVVTALPAFIVASRLALFLKRALHFGSQ